MLKDIFTLIKKELLIEWKQKYAFNGLLLYMLSMVVVISMAFVDQLEPQTWNIIFWLIMLFVAINAVAKSFMGEGEKLQMYLYGLVSPEAIIIAKFVYNVGLLFVISLISFYLFVFWGDMNVASYGRFTLVLGVGAIAISANLTLVSAIAAKGENTTTLLAVLSFPLLVPVLLLLIEISEAALTQTVGNFSNDSLQVLLGMALAMIIASVVLFPFIWKE